ncbi:Eco57I restriction-modification methylase domain-containing protein [Branchiibius hedensis]|nr:N-6 DNA methylase [Branchiibius hedensis]
MTIRSLEELVACAVALGAENVDGLSVAEKELIMQTHVGRRDVAALREQIATGIDPLGDAFCALRSAEERRPQGQTYTPALIVDSMINWAKAQGEPARVVDPGVGSGRYLLKAAVAFPDAVLIGADLDPIAALMARANLNAAGHADRARVELVDYRALMVEGIEGRTLYVGNPPYVRHHGITQDWKQWLSATAALHGYKASQLAGLHVHFFLATLQHATTNDFGAFVTSSEWLDVNYGALVRQMLLGKLGGDSVHVVDPAAMPFDANTTAAITCFNVGRQVESITLQSVNTLPELGALSNGHAVAKERLIEAPRWMPLLRVTPKLPEGYVELGELARVHRGTVTGANAVWVTHRDTTKLPESLLQPSVTKARELFAAGSVLQDTSTLRVVIDLPTELDELDPDERRKVDAFLRRPEVKVAKQGFVASNRKAWWSVGLRSPAPILATYMARRPPAFVRNAADARHINIAHGLYPREAMSVHALAKLTEHLRVSVTLGQGRTYAGGLTKFEPREMERLPVPTMELLNDDGYTPKVGQ